MTKETTKTHPTHRGYAVTNGSGRKFWQPIGAMWAHADANGFNLRINYAQHIARGRAMWRANFDCNWLLQEHYEEWIFWKARFFAIWPRK